MSDIEKARAIASAIGPGLVEFPCPECGSGCRRCEGHGRLFSVTGRNVPEHLHPVSFVIEKLGSGEGEPA